MPAFSPFNPDVWIIRMETETEFNPKYEQGGWLLPKILMDTPLFCSLKDHRNPPSEDSPLGHVGPHYHETFILFPASLHCFCSSYPPLHAYHPHTGLLSYPPQLPQVMTSVSLVPICAQPSYSSFISYWFILLL
jgi:hypothetical protein